MASVFYFIFAILKEPEKYLQDFFFTSLERDAQTTKHLANHLVISKLTSINVLIGS